MKDINKKLTKEHFKCYFFKWCEETTHFCGNMSLWSCSKSCLHFSLMFSEGEVKSPCFLQVVSPVLNKICYSCYCQLCPIKWSALDILRDTCTVKPVYSGHLGEFDKMTTIDRWPLYEGIWLFDEIFYSSCK